MNEINRIRQLAGLAPLKENEADMQTMSNSGDNQSDAEFDASQGGLGEEVAPSDVDAAVAKYRSGEIDFNALRSMLDDLEFTDHSMRQGEMGMIDGDTMAGHRAFDRERSDWDELDTDRDFDEIDFDQDIHEELDSLILEYAGLIDEKAPPGMEDLVLKLKKEYPGEEEKAFATAWSIYNKKNLNEGNYWDEHIDPWHGNAAKLAKAPKSTMQGSKVWSFSDMVCDTIEKHGIRDAFQYYVVKHGLPPRMFKIFAAKALYPHKFKKEQKVGEDLNNGYHDVNYACGDDYFPDGADGPVVDKTGPSGARQGDNPEQKKMQIDEVHSELVYSYRKFLEESSQKKR